ncbi:hypothetical protein JHK85_054981 [Glycine max]|nr:hypothetical protein JHK86_054025 [Glycine max]KAG4928495.1 hypothetical protein JHK85_054981 [Glycine max]
MRVSLPCGSPSSPSNPTPSIAAASRDSTPPVVATTTREIIFFDGETTTMTLWRTSSFVSPSSNSPVHQSPRDRDLEPNGTRLQQLQLQLDQGRVGRDMLHRRVAQRRHNVQGRHQGRSRECPHLHAVTVVERFH